MRKALYAAVGILIMAALIKTGMVNVPAWKGKRVSGKITLKTGTNDGNATVAA